MWWMINTLIVVFAMSTVVTSDDGIILPWRNQTKESRIIGGSTVSISSLICIVLIVELQCMHLTIVSNLFICNNRHPTIDIHTQYQYFTMDSLPVVVLSLLKIQFSPRHIVLMVEIILMI